MCSNFGPKFLRKRAKILLGKKHIVFGELDPITYPPRTKELEILKYVPRGRKEGTCSWNHPFALGCTWFLRTGAQNLVTREQKGFKYTTKLPRESGT
jgi:hypothetical protein